MSFFEKLKIGIWNVGIIESPITDILQNNEYEIKWMKHRYTDRFFADPFLYKSDDLFYFLLAEELVFYEGHGRIVLLKIRKCDMQLIEKKYIISETWHLSYPIVHNGLICPEAYKSGCLSSYEMNGDSLQKKLIIDRPLIDPTFLRYDDTEWIFATTRANDIDAIKKLSIFYKEDGKYIPHQMNPVKEDIRTARPGGHFFTNNGKLYRPVQDCENIYGGQIRLMEVEKLTKNDYVEKPVMEISSKGSSNYNEGLHTFNVENGFVVVDGFIMKHRLRKALYVKCPKLIKRFDKEKREGLFIYDESPESEHNHTGI